MSIQKRILKLEEARGAFVQELLQHRLMLRGSFGVASRRCGKPTCRCAQGEGHPYNRLTWSEGSRSRTKTIPVEDADWARGMAENYRRFRSTRKSLREVEQTLKRLFDELEDQLVEKAREQRSYF